MSTHTHTNLLTLSQLLRCHDNAAGANFFSFFFLQRHWSQNAESFSQLLFDHRCLPSNACLRREDGEGGTAGFRPKDQFDDVTTSSLPEAPMGSMSEGLRTSSNPILLRLGSMRSCRPLLAVYRSGPDCFRKILKICYASPLCDVTNCTFILKGTCAVVRHVQFSKGLNVERATSLVILYDCSVSDSINYWHTFINL